MVFVIFYTFFLSAAAKRNHIQRIFDNMERRNSEIMETLCEIKTVMKDACKVIDNLKI